MNLKMLEEVSSVRAISSRERHMVEYLKQKLTNYKIDGLHCVIAWPEQEDANLPKLMFCTHQDEVGFIVEEICGRFLRLHPFGSIWPHLVVGDLCTLETSNGRVLTGVISSPSSHAMPEADKKYTVKPDCIYLDLGIDADDVTKLGIKIGDMCCPKADYMPLANPKYVLNKAFDDRSGCYVGLEVLGQKLPHENNLYWAFSSQEEPGLRGARTVTDMVRPDLAFALDATLAGDTPFDDNGVTLGGGVILCCIDSNTLPNRSLLKWVEGLCKNHNIKYQYSVFNRGGTDSGNIHKSLGGIVNMSLGIPARYMHCNHSVVNTDDLAACIELCSWIIKEFKANTLEEILKL